MRVLYADADVQFANRISAILTKQGCVVDIASDAPTCFCYADFDVYDVIIIDSSVSPEDNLLVLRQLRKNNNSTPVLFIGSKRSVQEAVSALDGGADDYMSKPLSTVELAARVRALSRRKPAVLQFNTVSYLDLTLDLNTNELLCNGKVIRLGVKEFQIIKLLISSGTQVLSKIQLAERVWGINSSAEYNNVEVYISFIRKKLKKLNSKVTVNTLRNSGYSLSSKK